jgi:phage terminase small subunit
MAEENGQRRIDMLVQALAVGESITEAARRSGYSERTVRRWLHKPKFARKVSRTRATMIDGAAGRMADAMTDAAGTLRELLKAESESVRLSAAKSILELGSKLREATEIEERLAAVEEKIANGKPCKPTWANRSGVSF